MKVNIDHRFSLAGRRLEIALGSGTFVAGDFLRDGGISTQYVLHKGV